MSRTSSLPGRPAEPAAGGEEGQPGLLLAGQDLELDAGLGLHPGEHVVGVGGLAHGGGGERQHVLDALVLGGLQRVRDRRDQPVDARRGRSPRPRRGVRRAAAPPCASARAAGARRGARPPPADAPCSNPRRGHRVSWAERYCQPALDRLAERRSAYPGRVPKTKKAKPDKGRQPSGRRRRRRASSRRSRTRPGPAGREGARLRARLGRVPRSGRRRAGLPLRSDLADLPLELHLRQRLPGHPGGPRGRRLLHAGRALLRRGRREARRRARGAAHPGDLAVPRRGHARRGWVAGRRGRRPPDPAAARAPASSRTGPGSRAARAARCTSWRCGRAASRWRPSRTSAGSCRSGGRTTGSTGPTTRACCRSRSASTTGAAGVRAATTCTGGARRRRRRTARASRCTCPTGRS